VRRGCLAGIWAPGDRHQSDQPHQASDALTIDQVTLGRKPRCHPARTVIGPGEILPIDQRQDRTVLLVDLGRFAIDQAARYQQPALPGYRQRWARALDQRGVPLGSFAALSCQKIVFDLQLTDLPIPKIDRRRAGHPLGRRAVARKNPRGAVQQPLLPVVDLVRMDPELTGQLSDRPVAPCLRRGKLLIAASAGCGRCRDCRNSRRRPRDPDSPQDILCQPVRCLCQPVVVGPQGIAAVVLSAGEMQCIRCPQTKVATKLRGL
jgi:hypothetical protein